MKKFISFAVVLAMLLTGVTAVSAANEECVWGEECPSANYVDLAVGDWFHEDVDTILLAGVMEGVAENTFAPGDALTRAMFVTVLYRTIGEPEVNAKTAFTDLEANSWYEKAVIWAEANGVTNGYTATTFVPDDHVSREQMATLLYRMADSYKLCDTTVRADLAEFSDGEDVSDWALEAMKWAVAQNIFRGDENGALNPADDAERCQAAAVVVRLEDAVVGDTPEEDEDAPSEDTPSEDTPSQGLSDADEIFNALKNGDDVVITGTVNGETQVLPWGEEYSALAAEYYSEEGGAISGVDGELVMDEGYKFGLFVYNVPSISDLTLTGNSQSLFYIQNESDDATEISNVTVNANGGSGIYAKWAKGGVVLENCTVKQNGIGEGYKTWFETAVAAANGSNVTINSGYYESSKYAVYIFTSGATVTINDGTFIGELRVDKGELVINGGTFSVDPSAYVAKDKKVEESNGKYVIVDPAVDVSDANTLTDALTNVGYAAMTEDIDANGQVVIENGALNGNGNTLTVKSGENNYDSGLTVAEGTVKNVTVTGAFRGLGVGSSGKFEMTGDVVYENVTVTDATYGINIGKGNGHKITMIGCDIPDWNSYSGLSGAQFTDCAFRSAGKYYASQRISANATFTYTNCNFEQNTYTDGTNTMNYYLDSYGNGTIVFKNCYMDGVLITEDNVNTLFTIETDTTVQVVNN